MHVADTTKSLDFGGFLYRVHEDLDLMLDGSLPTIRMINVDGGVLFISTCPFQEDYPSFFREVCLVEYRRGVRYFHMYMCIMLFSFFSLSRLFAVLIWFFRSFLLLVEGTISPPVGLLASFLRCSNRSHLRSPSVMVPPWRLLFWNFYIMGIWMVFTHTTMIVVSGHVNFAYLALLRGLPQLNSLVILVSGLLYSRLFTSFWIRMESIFIP